jgi:aspartate kinase
MEQTAGRMDIIVQKYGGTSLASLDDIRTLAEHIAGRHTTDGPTVVVVSARGDTTSRLLALSESLGATRTGRETDQLLVTGEYGSAATMAMALRGFGVPAVSLTGQQAGIRAVGKHGEGTIASIDTRRVHDLLRAGNIVVVAGFHGENDQGDVITLGRGGSDTTAVALAGELRAERCEIYTDVDGIYTADPRSVPSARVLRTVDVAVMAEMAFAGARVLHSRAVELSAMRRIELQVRRSWPRAPGTVIPTGSDTHMLETSGVVVAITHDTDVARVLVGATGSRRDLAADVLGLLAGNSVPADLVARSGPNETEFRMGFTIRRSDVEEIRAPLLRYLSQHEGRLHIDDHVGKLSLIGMGLLNRPQYTSRMLSVLSAAGIPTSWISTSQLRTSVVVPRDRVIDGVGLLHHEFALADDGAHVQPVAS